VTVLLGALLDFAGGFWITTCGTLEVLEAAGLAATSFFGEMSFGNSGSILVSFEERFSSKVSRRSYRKDDK
jgi:hypothetical protein